MRLPVSTQPPRSEAVLSTNAGVAFSGSVSTAGPKFSAATSPPCAPTASEAAQDVVTLRKNITLGAAQDAVTLSRANALRKNISLVLTSHMTNLLRNFKMLNENALIFSTLLLSLSHIYISNHTALKARNTPEAEHRAKEAVKTSIREIGGWTLSFVVFRMLQRGMEWGLRRFFSIKPPESLMFLSSRRLKEAVRLGRQGQLMEKSRPFYSRGFEPEEQLIHLPPRMSGPVEKGPVKMVQAYRKLYSLLPIKKFLSPEQMDQAAAGDLRALGPEVVRKIVKRVSNLYTRIPLAVGGIPAVYLSGFWLERYTQNNSETGSVAQVLTRKLHDKGRSQPGKSSGVSQYNFSSYLQHIQQKQTERGLF